MTMGAILSAARKVAALSQKDLAARIMKEDGTPISPPYLNDIERDRRNPPSPFLLKQFSEVLSLSYEYLLFVANQLPDDLRDIGASYRPEQVEAAFEAFRKALNRD